MLSRSKIATMLVLLFSMLLFSANALCRFSPVRSHVQLALPLLSSTRLFASKNVRPSLDDVERISRGDAAKRRGTGSRMVPHRLNQSERKEWVLAKKRRFLLLRGSGYRKERGASPLANIYRQFCDAQVHISTLSQYPFYLWSLMIPLSRSTVRWYRTFYALQ